MCSSPAKLKQDIDPCCMTHFYRLTGVKSLAANPFSIFRFALNRLKYNFLFNGHQTL